MSEAKRNFDRLLIESVTEGLTKILGDNNAKCVMFYVDPNMAVADPDNYARALLGLFGMGTKVMLDTIIDTLYQKTGAAKSETMSFGQSVADARINFQQKGTVSA